ncbi:MAG: metal-dependent transcriptional regulator [Nanoarchaeota archaeon]
MKFCINIEDEQNNVFALTLNEIKYLKIIFRFFEEEKAISLTTLSKILGIRPSSVLDTINSLINKGLIIKTRRKIELTEKGLRLMKFIIMKKRILELFFFHILDLSAQLSRKEADKIDYLVSCKTIEKIVEKLEKRKINTKSCIHNKPTYIEEFFK